MRHVVAIVAGSGVAALLALAGCASTPPQVGDGPLSPVGDMSQVGIDDGARPPEHDFTGVPPGIGAGGGGGVDDGPAVAGGMRGSGGL